MLHTRQQQTEEALARMAARNDARRQIVLRVMGAKYAHHPVNHVQRERKPIVSIKLSDAALNRLMADIASTPRLLHYPA